MVADGNGSSNGVDVRRLTIPVIAVAAFLGLIVAAVGGSIATIYAWRLNDQIRNDSQDHQINDLKSWRDKVNGNHYGFRYADAFNWCLALERANDKWVCVNPYTLPTSNGDPPLFPMVIRDGKNGLDRQSWKPVE
jgi:hypothetical protein